MFQVAVVTDSDPYQIQRLIDEGYMVLNVEYDGSAGCLISPTETKLKEVGELVGMDTRYLLFDGQCSYLEVTIDIETLLEIMSSKPQEFQVSDF